MTPPRVSLDLTCTQRPRLTGWERFALEFRDQVAQRTDVAELIEVRWPQDGRGRWHVLSKQLLWHASGWRHAPREVDVHHSMAYPPGKWPVPTVWTVHDDLILGGHRQYARRAARVWTPLARRSLGRVARIVTDTRSVADELVALGAAREQISVATPGVPRLGEPTGPPQVRDLSGSESGIVPKAFALAVGTIEPRKRPDVAANAAASAGLPLVVVGRIDHQPGWAPPQSTVLLAADVTDGQLAWLYRNASVFVSASAYEGLDFPLLEALSNGTPSVASDIPVHRELADGVVSFAPVGDADATAKAMATARSPNGWTPPSWDDCVVIYGEVYRQISQRDP